MTKAQIRKEILKKLKTQNSPASPHFNSGRRDPAERRSDEARREKLKTIKDEIIREKLLSLPEYKRAKAIACYVSFGGEVDTTALIDEALAAGKIVTVPAIVGDDLKLYGIKDRRKDLTNRFCGILQPDINGRPFPKEDIGLVIVPGIAFTKLGGRLGRGKGFYDRFLKTLPSRMLKIGLAYDFQIVKDLPTTPRDIPVDLVITN